MSPLIRAEDVQTLPGLFREVVSRSPEARAYMTYDADAQTWREITWRAMAARADRFRAAMEALGLEFGDRVALLIPNGIDWVCFDMAALRLGLVVVPLFSYDSPSNHAFILRDSGARLVLVDTTERWQAIADLDEPLTDIEQVWVRDGSSAPLAHPLKQLADLLPEPAVPSTEILVRPDDLATLIYTSGTTGRPKGVRLSHAAMLWNAYGVAKFITPRSDDVFLSVLPLAHAFERTVGYYLPMLAGATVAYARSVELLREDFSTVRPTAFVSVPRLYERIHAAIRDPAAHGWIVRRLVDIAARVGWQHFEWKQGRASRPSVFIQIARIVLNQLLTKRVLGVFGGRLRVAASGGAALPRDVSQFLIGLGLPLVEGYGLTEAAPVVTATALTDNFPGSVGRPLEGCEIRLSDEGELLVRSPGLMQGYWNDPQRTAAAFDANGFLKTGDIAEIRDGRVFIRGRLKQIIVLSTGENINPEPIEAAIQRDPLVQHACVIGDGKPFAIAVMVLHQGPWQRLAEDLNVDPSVPNLPVVKAELMKRISSRLEDFPKPAQIGGIHLVLDSWTVQNGRLTPTLKVKRRAIEADYLGEIRALYAGHAHFE